MILNALEGDFIRTRMFGGLTAIIKGFFQNVVP